MQLSDLLDPSLPLESIVHSSEEKGYFLISPKKFTSATSRRLTLGRFFEDAAQLLKKEGWSENEARAGVREAWKMEAAGPIPWELPGIIGQDPFLCAYALGSLLPLFLVQRICLSLAKMKKGSELKPLYVRSNPLTKHFYDVKATPPGLLPKLFSKYRLKKDAELLECVQSDLDQIATYESHYYRKIMTLSILSHGAVYRELDGMILHLPSLGKKLKGKSIPYAFTHHLLWEGIKTVSARPLELETEEPGIYLCQGTEIWPSQPSSLSSLAANLGKHGPATEPYAYSWRQIHAHLRSLRRESGPHPIVIGHSLGGSFAIQIALYSNRLISEAYAFNPPGIEIRDAEVYQKMNKVAQKKINVFANLDDLPFWRIGSQIIGQVFIALTADRKTYRPIAFRDWIFIFPALIKVFWNVIEALPAHQSIYLLHPQYVLFPLSEEEISLENAERIHRPDHIQFIQRLNPTAKRLLSFSRRHFRWQKEKEYLESQIEILTLHEQDLLETLSEGGKEGQETLKEIRRQKELAQNRLNTFFN